MQTFRDALPVVMGQTVTGYVLLDSVLVDSVLVDGVSRECHTTDM